MTATDYSKSKFENATAERAYAVTLEGFSEDSIYNADGTVLFDFVATDEDGATILCYDSQGFVWVETSERGHALNGKPADVHGHYGRNRVECHWSYLQREYAIAETED